MTASTSIKEFDLWLQRKELLVEMAGVLNSIDQNQSKQAKEYFQKILDENRDFLEKIRDNIFMLNMGLNSLETIVYELKDDEILSVAFFRQIPRKLQVGSKKEFVYEAKLTFNYKSQGAMKKLYSAFSKRTKSYISGDSRQSESSIRILSSWYRNKEIKNIFIYNIQEEKILEIPLEEDWSGDPEIRIIAKF